MMSPEEIQIGSILTHPYTTAACAAGIVTVTACRDGSRAVVTTGTEEIRRQLLIALGCEYNEVESTHDMAYV